MIIVNLASVYGKEPWLQVQVVGFVAPVQFFKGSSMMSRRPDKRFPRMLPLALTAMGLGACTSAPLPPSFGADWKQVNAFTAEVQVLPFYAEHVYFVRPLDGTLKGLLQRWSKESGLPLDYRANADFTLSASTGNVRSESLRNAVTCLNAIYRPHGAAISLTPANSILVSHVLVPRDDVPQSLPACAVVAAEPAKPDVAQTGPITAAPIIEAPITPAASPRDTVQTNLAPERAMAPSASEVVPPATAGSSLPPTLPETAADAPAPAGVPVPAQPVSAAFAALPETAVDAGVPAPAQPPITQAASPQDTVQTNLAPERAMAPSTSEVVPPATAGSSLPPTLPETAAEASAPAGAPFPAQPVSTAFAAQNPSQP